jgi:hypothetical protein
MSFRDSPELARQREALCAQLRAHRVVVSQQLDATKESHAAYPRSMTMRFLTRNSGGVIKLCTEAAVMLIGARLFRSTAATRRR